MKIGTRHHKNDACALLSHGKIPRGIFSSVSNTALSEIYGLIEDCHVEKKGKNAATENKTKR